MIDVSIVYHFSYKYLNRALDIAHILEAFVELNNVHFLIEMCKTYR